MKYVLRSYQLAAVESCRAAIRSGRRRIVVVAPTGSGKTILAGSIIDAAVNRGNRVLFLAHRQELIEQASKKLDDNLIDHGVIKSGHWRALPHLRVQVASVQTLARRSEMPPAELVITDEAHHVAAGSYKKILSHYPKAVSLGLTATPYRTDGKGLGDFFERMVEVADIPTLIADGYLVEPIVYAPSMPDLDDVHTIAGDYDRRELAVAMDRPKLVGDLVTTWCRLAAGRTTVAFATSIEHSQHIVDEFNKSGIRAAHLDGTTDDALRADTLAQLADGRLTIISNMGILTEGWDLPRTSCVILARPTKSRGLYFQMVGRGLRTSDGKRDCIILDHAACCMSHGYVTDPQTYSLAGIQKKPRETAPGFRICSTCYAVVRIGLKGCNLCGVVFPIVHRDTMPEHIDGELQLQNSKVYLPIADDLKKISKYKELVATAAAREYSPKWPAMRFKILFGHWPDARHRAI